MHSLHTLLLSLVAVNPLLSTFAAPTELQQSNGGYAVDKSLSSPQVRSGTSLESRGDGWIPIGNSDIRIKEEIGRGAFAAVYAADLRPNKKKRRVAVKVHQGDPNILPPIYVIDRKITDYSNVLRFLDAAEVKGTQYLVMERASVTLEERIQANEFRSNNDRVRRHITGVVNGLLTLHNAGIAHNDGHSENVVFIDGVAKLIDFDLITEGQMKSHVCGRRDILGPEALGLTGTSVDTYRNDVWAAGVTLLRMMTKQNPWRDARDDLAKRIWQDPSRTERQRRLKKYFPTISTELSTILARVFTTQGQRYSSVEFYSRLRSVQAFYTSQPSRMVIRATGDEEDDLDNAANYICNLAGGGGNSTAPSTRRSVANGASSDLY